MNKNALKSIGAVLAGAVASIILENWHRRTAPRYRSFSADRPADEQWALSVSHPASHDFRSLGRIHYRAPRPEPADAACSDPRRHWRSCGHPGHRRYLEQRTGIRTPLVPDHACSSRHAAILDWRKTSRAAASFPYRRRERSLSALYSQLFPSP